MSHYKNLKIGGPHSLPKKTYIKNFDFDGYTSYYMANSRSSIYLASLICNADKLWLPSYVCESLINICYNYDFYEVDGNFKPINLDPKATDLVVIIEYFGIEVDIPQLDCWLLVDKSQSVSYNTVAADFTVMSFTKHMGYPDGSILFSKLPANIDLISAENTPWFNKNLKFRNCKKSNYEKWYRHYLASKKELPPFGLYRMSEFTRSKLGNESYGVFNKNKENFLCLKEWMSPMIDIGDSIPTGFPIMLNERDALQKLLAANGVFCPVHWRLAPNLDRFSSSYNISKSILTIPCDYRYGFEEMEYIKYVFKKFSINTLQ